MTTSAWMVRGGRDGEREDLALRHGLAVAGWDEVGDLRPATTRALLRADHVVMPLRPRTHVAVGRIAGPYEYREDEPPGLRHIRRVEWRQRRIPRSHIEQDLLDSLGSLMTVCRLQRFEAANRVASLAETGTDPGPADRGATERSTSGPMDLVERVGAVEPGDAYRTTIRELLSCWGAVRRSASVVDQIEHDMSRHRAPRH